MNLAEGSPLHYLLCPRLGAAAKWAVPDFEPVTWSLSGGITRVLNWLAEAMSRYQLRLCGWTSPAGAWRGWQLAPRMAPVLRIRRPR